jgi:hypothetical protein
MSPNRHNPDHGPSRQLLQAFTDGELDACTHADVEEWLCRHPEAQNAIERDRQLLALFRDNPPPEPDSATWDDVLGQIHEALRPCAHPTPRPPSAGFRRRWGTRLLLGLFTTAAMIAGVLVARPLLPGVPAKPILAREVAVEDNEPFPVVSADDVNILSVDACDADSLVMGPPLIGSFAVAESNDVEILSVGSVPMEGSQARLDASSVAMILFADEPEEP